MTKMTVTQALWERKNLKSRIAKETEKGLFLSVVVGDTNKPSHNIFPTEDALKAKIQSSVDSVQGLIGRYHTIVGKLLSFNANTQVTIAGLVMTVAQAIERRESSKLELSYLSAVKNQIVSASREVSVKRQALDREIEARVANNKVDGMTVDDIKTLQQEAETMLNRQREPKLFDPLNMIEKIEQQAKVLQEFLDTLEVELNVVNATNYIEL